MKAIDFNNLTQEQVEAIENATYYIEVYEAYNEVMGHHTDIDELIRDADDNYQGEYDSDKDFAQQLAEDIGAIDPKAGWPNNCINWEWAAQELMYDYACENGHYFRSV